ncbi:hypothetical protein HS7_05130 [Sulfolobales archaeon HS-7]|nr:hypothetical protein HS7_05130 [Sulfolobales archaeon HS-7]
MNVKNIVKSIPLLSILAVIVLLSLGAFTPLLSAQGNNILYIPFVESTAFQSLSTYNPNIFSGGLGGDFYGIVYAYSGVLNVSNGQMLPGLIVNWSFSPANWMQVWQNQTVNVTYTIRNDSGWADGTPVTAWDIAATCYVLDMYGAPPFANITVINNYTVVFSYPKGSESPYNMPFRLMCTVGLGEVAVIIPYNEWKPIINEIIGNWSALQSGKIPTKDFRSIIHSYKPTGSLAGDYNGPFYVAQITPSEIILDKNPYYYAANQIPFSQAVVYQYTSASTAEAALESGQISLDYSAVYSPPSSILTSLPSYYNIVRIPQPGGYALYYNLKDPLLDSVYVRQAIAYVLNRTAIALAGGIKYSPVNTPNGIPNFTYFQEFMTPAVSNLNHYNVNLSLAKVLLEKAGFTFSNGEWYAPNGSEFTLNIMVPFSPGPGVTNMMDIITNELTSFGIKTTYFVSTTTSTNHEMYDTGKGYDMVLQNWGGYFPGTVDWGLPLSYLGGYPFNVTQWNHLVTLPNGTTYNLTKLYQETSSPNSTQQLISANDQIAYAMNYFIPIIPLVKENAFFVYNSKDIVAPPANSWIYQEELYGIGGTALLQVGLSYSLFTPVSVTTTTTPPVTTTTTPPSTVTTTTSVPPTLLYSVIAVIIVVIVVAAVVLLLRRR